MLRRIWRESVWSRNGVPQNAWRFRGIFRWVLPLTDVFFIWFGVAGIIAGISSVRDAASYDWQEAWSLGLAVCATSALIGVSFPRLWLVELLAKIPLISLVSVYIFVLIERGLNTDPTVAATAGLVVILILAPVWRIFDLSGHLWRFRAVRVIFGAVSHGVKYLWKRAKGLVGR